MSINETWHGADALPHVTTTRLLSTPESLAVESIRLVTNYVVECRCREVCFGKMTDRSEAVNGYKAVMEFERKGWRFNYTDKHGRMFPAICPECEGELE